MLGATAVTLVPACGHIDATDVPEPRYPGNLVPAHQLGHPFMARQRVTVWKSGPESSIDVVLTLHEGRLRVNSRTRARGEHCVIEQRATYVATEPCPDPPPASLRYLLLDIHRMHFMALPGAPLPDGLHRAEHEGERVSERWSRGLLLERTFERSDGGAQGQIIVRYPGGKAAGCMPASIEYDNGWLGYSLAVQTLEHRQL